MLSLVYALSYCDRQIITVLTEQIKDQFDLSDIQIGLLIGPAFALFYSFFGLPLASLADRKHRVSLIASCTAIWSIFMIWCGLAGSFVQLCLARMGVAVGEAGCSPAALSLISDSFPPNRRGIPMALYALGVPVGGMAGVILGGALGSAYGWRVALIAVGAPGIILAGIVYFVVREPPRGQFDVNRTAPDGDAMIDSIKVVLREIRSSPALRWLMVSASLAGFAGYGMLSWIPSLLLRTKGMQLHELGLYYGVLSGVCAIIGTLLSGYLVDRFSERWEAIYGIIPGVAFILAMPPFMMAVSGSDWTRSLFLLALPMLFYTMYSTPTIALLHSRIESRHRAMATAMVILTITCIGLAGGPLFVGLVSDLASTDENIGIVYGVASLGPVFGLCGLAYLLVARAIVAEARKAGEKADQIGLQSQSSSHASNSNSVS